MTATAALPVRAEVPAEDTWDLGSLYADDAAWEADFAEWQKKVPRYDRFEGTLGDGPAAVAKCLKFDGEIDRLGERLGTYVFLKTSQDVADSGYQGMHQRYMGVASKAGQASSFISPELLALPKRKLASYLEAKELKRFRLALERLVRRKPHTLSQSGENLLAMQGEMAEATNGIFSQLNDSDLDFGKVKDGAGNPVELTHSSFAALLQDPKRAVRRKAFHQLYGEYQAHANTLAATLKGSIQRDVYYAKARNHGSALERALFPDNVPVAVYDHLIATVRRFLPSLHRYYGVRRRALKLQAIHHYDTYVPILPDLRMRHSWDEAVDRVVESLAPLGDAYTNVLAHGLRGRWADRYENKGKRSGAFSCGSFDGDPYILMNYQPDVLDHVFTLTHEAGHSMHSHFSSKHQPFETYDYVIFVAEVASTFNEELLAHHMLERAADDRQRAYLISREIDDIRGTIFRQTMFAEFERTVHAMAEANEPLTVASFRAAYRELLDAYFGDGFAIDECLSLECLRIPHFYRAFYVYKYATGLSAAIALSQRVLAGGKDELDAYLDFLKGGCSKDPLDLLRDAGVDMESPEPVAAALTKFDRLVDELDGLL